jgi:hypothetical protein
MASTRICGWRYDEAGMRLSRTGLRPRSGFAAKYEEGVFRPLEKVTIKEGTEVEVRLPSCADGLKVKSPSVRDFAFYGIWKDRADIGDSVEYVNSLRRDLRA